MAIDWSLMMGLLQVRLFSTYISIFWEVASFHGPPGPPDLEEKTYPKNEFTLKFIYILLIETLKNLKLYLS